MKNKFLLIIGIVIIAGIVGIMMILSNDSNKIINSSSLEYLRTLQKLCKQNENSDSVSVIDGPMWQNSTHYFDVPDCRFRNTSMENLDDLK